MLYERWGTIPEFQRTRGVLRLLADVMSNLYQAKDNEAVIQSGSVNLGAPAVRGELVKHTGHGSVFHSVIASDIAGSHAKAPEIDRQLGSEYAKESVSEKLARAIFMYSFSGGQLRGATLPHLRLAVLNPEMAPPFISDSLSRMTKRPASLSQRRPVPLRLAREPEPHPGGPRGDDPLRAGKGAGLRPAKAQ